MDRFPELFSGRMPDRMISYTWAGFTLLTDLPLFLDAAERLHPPAAADKTYWLDIAFTCQNSPDIKLYLDIADGLYAGAWLHFAFLCRGMVRRAWCNAEIVIRTKAGLAAHGLAGGEQDWTDAVIRGGELLADGDDAFTTFVAVHGHTDMENDILDVCKADRFERMEAFDPDDLAEIRAKIMGVFGTAEAFNFAMLMVRNAVLTRYDQQHAVRPPPRPPP
jgi:hypothetical protein